MFDVQEDDLSSFATRELLTLHFVGMHSHSPAGNVFALDLTGLQSPEVTVWTARSGNRIAAVGTLKMLSDRTAEIKSMRTHPNFLRRGAAAAILETIIDTAADRGVERLSLETGSGDAFEPALTLYRRRGFVKGDAFGDYEESEFNQFLHLEVQTAASRVRQKRACMFLPRTDHP